MIRGFSRKSIGFVLRRIAFPWLLIIAASVVAWQNVFFVNSLRISDQHFDSHGVFVHSASLVKGGLIIVETEDGQYGGSSGYLPPGIYANMVIPWAVLPKKQEGLFIVSMVKNLGGKPDYFGFPVYSSIGPRLLLRDIFSRPVVRRFVVWPTAYE